MPSSRRGFTLLELVIIVGIILFLAGSAFVALDPLKRGAQARNSRRASDLESVSKAGALRIARAEPLSVDYEPITWQMIGTPTEGCDMFCGKGGALKLRKVSADSWEYVTVANQAPFNFQIDEPFSIAAWARVEETSFLPFILAGKADLNLRVGYVLFLGTRGVGFNLFNGIGGDPFDQPLHYLTLEYPTLEMLIGETHHVVGTYDGSGTADGLRIYVDGIEADPNLTTQRTRGSLATAGIGNSAPFRIGASQQLVTTAVSEPHTPFEGTVDDVRVYSGMLTPEEVQLLYQGKEPPNPMNASLLSHWTFNDATKSEAVIDRAEDNDGRLVLGTAQLPANHSVIWTGSLVWQGGIITEPQCFDISPDLVQQDYLAGIPFDPNLDELSGITGYAINRVGGSIVTRACSAEGTGPMASGEPPLIEVAH